MRKLTHYGYLVENDWDKLGKEIAEDLQIIPQATSEKYPNGSPIFCWQVDSTGKWLLIPRFYGEWKFGKVPEKLVEGLKIPDVSFGGLLSETQKEVIKKITEMLGAGHGAIAQLPTGSGKTRIGLKVIL